MPIWLLRHEERERNETSFDTPLTSRGLRRAATTVADRLAALNVERVYCSPYVRCAQTVLPFCWRSGVPLHVEPALFEYDAVVRHPPSELTPREQLIVGGRCSHAPFLKTEALDALTFEDRIDGFREFITTTYAHEGTNIALCTHLSCINRLLGRTTDAPLDFGGIVALDAARPP